MATLGGTELAWEDLGVIIIYLFLVLSVGILCSARKRENSVKGYFLAARSMNWIIVGFSLYATNIGSYHFVGLAGSAARSGIAIASFELNGLLILPILGWIFLPVYLASGVYTMPEYLRKRFGGERIRIYLCVVALMLSVFTKISTDLYAGAIFIHQSLKLDLYIAVVLLLLVCCLYTIAGGLTAVMWTDFVQTIFMISGAAYLAILSLSEVGGYHSLIEKFKTAMPDQEFARNYSYNLSSSSTVDDKQTCNKVPDDYMHLFRSVEDPELPWTGITFGLTISSIWFWCTDQVIVQRTLSAKSLTHAKAGSILCGYLKLFPMFLIILPGMAARILYPDVVACSDPQKCMEACGNEMGCTNIAYSLLVNKLMPTGARGLMLSVILSALMSSLSSIFNSSSTIFTMDIWRRARKEATELELLIVGRLCVLLLLAISIAWIPVITALQSSQLFHYVQSVTSYLAPPICAVYLLAVLCPRVNEKGAFWSLVLGLIIGLIRLIIELSYKVPKCGEKDLRPLILSKVNYLHFGIILFIVVSIVAICISVFTEPIDERHLYRLTFWSRESEEQRDDLDIWIPTTQIHDIPTLAMNAIAFSDDSNTMEVTLRKKGGVSDVVGEYKELPEECSETFKEFLDLLTLEETASNRITNGTVNAAVSGGKGDLEMKAILLRGAKKDPDKVQKKKRSLWYQLKYFFCGISEELKASKRQVEVLCPEEEAKTAVEYVKQTRPWSLMCNVNCIILLLVALSVWIYYA